MMGFLKEMGRLGAVFRRNQQKTRQRAAFTALLALKSRL
jgi:hypothetical protein